MTGPRVLKISGFSNVLSSALSDSIEQFSHECPTSCAFPLSCVRRLVSRFTLTRLSGQPCAESQMQTRVLGTRKRLSLAVTDQTTIRKDYWPHRPGQDVKRPSLLLSYTSLAGN